MDKRARVGPGRPKHIFPHLWPFHLDLESYLLGGWWRSHAFADQLPQCEISTRGGGGLPLPHLASDRVGLTRDPGGVRRYVQAEQVQVSTSSTLLWVSDFTFSGGSGA